MKKIYSKPETQIKISQMDVFMENISIDSNLPGDNKPTNHGGTSDDDNEEGGVKERDLWSDGLW
jgi:hypothetical protein